MNAQEYLEILMEEYYATEDNEYASAVFGMIANEPYPFKIPQRDKILMYLFRGGTLSLLAVYGYMRMIAPFIFSLPPIIVLWKFLKKKEYNTVGDYLLQTEATPSSRPSVYQQEKAIKALWRKKQKAGESVPAELDQAMEILDTIETTAAIKEPIADFNSQEWIKRFRANHTLYAYGSDAFPALLELRENGSFKHKETIEWLILNIAAKSRSLFSRRTSDYICHECLAHFSKQKLSLESFISTVIFYGCRICGKNKNYKVCPDGVVAVLDYDMDEDYQIWQTLLYGNWLKRRSLFDFDKVEIINATDKDVEQFCIQAGNDTDPIREPKYQQMDCVVKCELSKNTMRILENTFGEVENDVR